MKPIFTANDLNGVRTLPLAFIFIWVEWAGQARMSEATFSSFLTDWDSNAPGFAVPTYRVDLSDQQGETWTTIREWLRQEGQRVDVLTYGGNGALLWVRFGCVVASVPHVADLNRTEFMAITRNAFAGRFPLISDD